MTALQSPPEVHAAPVTETSSSVSGQQRRRRRRVARVRRPAPPSAPVGSMAWVVSTALFVLAALVVGFGLDVVVVSRLRFSAAQSNDYATFRKQLALGVAPVSQTDAAGNLVPVGAPVALLRIDRLGINNLVVVEGTSGEAMQRGPGHERDTRFPGQLGVSVVQGRSGAFGGPFTGLARLRVGDEIIATTGQGVSVYRVSGHRQAGDPAPAVSATGGRLTLVTAGGLAFVPQGVERVDAVLTGTPKDPSVIVARDLPASERPMGTMPDTLPVTILWLQAQLVCVLAAVWAWYRWGRWQTWIVFGPLLAIVTVVVSARVTLLLPNLL